MKTTGNFFTFDPQSTNQIQFPIRKAIIEENPSIFTVLKCSSTYRKNKKQSAHLAL